MSSGILQVQLQVMEIYLYIFTASVSIHTQIDIYGKFLSNINQ